MIEPDRITTVYTRKGCGPCTGTKLHMNRRGVPHDLIDVTGNQALEDMLRAEGYREMPVVKPAYGKPWTGYRPDLIDALASREAEADDVWA